jgi:methylglutaconyl-CoA hydratase
MIAEMTEAFLEADADEAVRAVTLSGEGQSFCAGADLGWMKRSAELDETGNERAAMDLSRLMAAIAGCRKPVIALVNGPAYGGGVGLVACCDIALASQTAAFVLSEVRLGIIPAVISPYVVAAIGARQCRRWFLTAEKMDAQTALGIGLVHRCVAPSELPSAAEEIVAHLLKGGPRALAEAKELIALVADRPIDGALRSETVRRIARQRASAEGKEGIAAFLEKRLPAWRRD